MRTIRLLCLVLAAATLAGSALAGTGSLDGKVFPVTVTLPDGQTLDNTYTFKNGMVESALCAQAGYPAAAYTAREEGGKTIVTASLKNKSGDTRTITATINKDQMKGRVDVDEGGETMQLKFNSKPVVAKKK